MLTDVMLFDGCVMSQDTPRRFFSENNYYTTSANKMVRHKARWALTAEDVIWLCKESRKKNDNQYSNHPCTDSARACFGRKAGRPELRRNLNHCGTAGVGDVFLAFERRRVQARELVVVASYGGDCRRQPDYFALSHRLSRF